MSGYKVLQYTAQQRLTSHGIFSSTEWSFTPRSVIWTEQSSLSDYMSLVSTWGSPAVVSEIESRSSRSRQV